MSRCQYDHDMNIFLYKSYDMIFIFTDAVQHLSSMPTAQGISATR